MKLTTLTILKCIVQRLSVFSQCCGTITILYFQNILSPRKRKPMTIKQSITIPPSFLQPLAITTLLSVSMFFADFAHFIEMEHVMCNQLSLDNLRLLVLMARIR